MLVGLIRSFLRSVEGITADFRCDGMSLHYKVGIAVRWTTSRSVRDGCVEASFDARYALADYTSAGRVLSLLHILGRI